MALKLRETYKIVLLVLYRIQDKNDDVYFRHENPRDAFARHLADVGKRSPSLLLRFFYFWNYRSSTLGRTSASAMLHSKWKTGLYHQQSILYVIYIFRTN
jgi:hypothetical protein